MPVESEEKLLGSRLLAGGSFVMGDHFDEGYEADGELPLHEVELDPFAIDETTVTNGDFARFVEDTGYVTDAEKLGVSAVFHQHLAAGPTDLVSRAAGTPWWLAVAGADWRHPAGPLSGIEEILDHPVVHVSWNDAVAYCEWAGKRLPTEAEWEYAARGGLDGARFGWGDEIPGDDEEADWPVNIWQGPFPFDNLVRDGFASTAPVRSYSPNGYGLWNMLGNVWEWCADWFAPDYYWHAPRHNPAGPARGVTRVMRGGSFLCHSSYCFRYRVAARSSNTPDSAASNIGFRCAVSVR
jgi:sulfatase modifying factor 1